MPSRDHQYSQCEAKAKAALQSACQELNNELKAKPGSTPNIAAAAHHHSINYTTLCNHFQGHTQSQRTVHDGYQLLSSKQEDVLIA
jgi:hypothetical protein